MVVGYHQDVHLHLSIRLKITTPRNNKAKEPSRVQWSDLTLIHHAIASYVASKDKGEADFDIREGFLFYRRVLASWGLLQEPQDIQCLPEV